MRSRTLFMLAVLVLATAACTSKAPQQTETEIIASINTPQPESAPDPAELKAEIKAGAVKEFNEAFQTRDNWTAALRGSVGDETCELRDKFSRIDGAMGYMNGQYVVQLNWNDVAVQEDVARKQHLDAALNYAKALNNMLAKPHTQRLLIGSCGSGEGAIDLSEGSNLMNELELALKSVGRRPHDIGVSTEQLRVTLLTDYKARIVLLRNEIAKASSDKLEFAQTKFAHLVSEARREWNFTYMQLEITAEEQRLVEDIISRG